MATNKYIKLRKMLELHKPGTVYVASWLKDLGISRDLQQHYRRSHWLESVGTGAFKYPNDTVQWPGGLNAIQSQLKLPVHVGGLTALSLQGLAHYVRQNGETIFLFSPLQTSLPLWFKKYDWGHPLHHTKTSMLPPDAGLIDWEDGAFKLKISAPERAILECLYLAPDNMDLVECDLILQGLTNLRPKVIQELLEKCTSIKVKRLFLFMASKANHQWLQFIDQKSVDLGHGNRSLVPHGVYVSQFKISVPRELAE